MKQKKTKRFRLKWIVSGVCISIASAVLMSSSHREAPMIAYDPLADNTDVYAFRSPTDHDKIVIIANYIPGQLPEDGPNYDNFGEHIRYEIHVKNNAATTGDDITYRFTFKKVNEDPTTFFHERLGKENQKDTYTLERFLNGSWKTIIENGIVPPPNIGPRSLNGMFKAGLDAGGDYHKLFHNAIMHAGTGETVFAGPVDDPFFADLGGIFDLGDAPRTDGTHAQDHLQCKNVSTLALEIPIETLQKNHKSDAQTKSILDPDYIIGVWASASRQKIKVLNEDHPGQETYKGDWVQVSRLGMPLTNEAIDPFGVKDLYNSLTPYQSVADQLKTFGNYFYNPELALYMDSAQFGIWVPALKPLRIQRKSLGAFDFTNGHDGLYPLKNNAALNGTALAENAFGGLLLPKAGAPRSVDLWPIFNTGVPNLRPYQLATGKAGNPLAEGKPFINNFLPSIGDMLRLNMAVPATPRNSKDFSSLGLVQAAVLGLTDPRFNTSKSIQNIPNMDGFPNGRRLEDDAIRIELQAVSGVVLAAIGLPYDDFKAGGSLATPNLIRVLQYHTGVDHNDTTLRADFPFEQLPWSGKHNCNCGMSQTDAESSSAAAGSSIAQTSDLGFSSPEIIANSTPNPVINMNTITYRLEKASQVKIVVYDLTGRAIKVLADSKKDAGTYNIEWNTGSLVKGAYLISINKDGFAKQSIRLIKE